MSNKWLYCWTPLAKNMILLVIFILSSCESVWFLSLSFVMYIVFQLQFPFVFIVVPSVCGAFSVFVCFFAMFEVFVIDRKPLICLKLFSSNQSSLFNNCDHCNCYTFAFVCNTKQTNETKTIFSVQQKPHTYITWAS